MNLLQKEFKEKLEKFQVNAQCEKLNIDFFKLFIMPLQNMDNNPYEFYKWEVKLSSAVGYTINAVPPNPEIDNTPWEEWLSLDNQNWHYILYLREIENFNGTWEGNLDDQNHPKEVLGKKWYYIQSNDLRPLYFQTFTEGL